MTISGATATLFATLLIMASTVAQAGSATEQGNLELIVRQLDMIDSLAKKSAALQPADGTRYHFDYERLQQDLKRVRAGITGYTSPSRAQPRDPSRLSGHYTRTGSDKP